ncbi:MAG: hypothetical protein FJ267_15010, partial [Planctomycetes bacterium]|nr:hypothetical protein [Planctomycetota bacterium]
MSHYRIQTREEAIVSEQLSELRHRVRFVTWVTGLSWLILVLFGGMLIAGWLDWLIHFDDPALRLLIGLTLGASSGYIAWRHLVAPLRVSLHESFLASRIERRFPGLANRVISAVEFLDHHLQADMGSPELQKAVVTQAISDLEQIDAGELVASKSASRIAFSSLVLMGVVLLVVVLRPLEAATSVQRLIFPYADVPWPRQFELQLIQKDLTPVVQSSDQPFLIARGDTLELYVINKRGQLP